MNLLKIKQHSSEWHQARLGNVTASRVADALSVLKRASNGRKAGEQSQTSLDYIMEKALERMTGREAWHSVTPAMQDGIDREPHARAAYLVITGEDAEKCGITVHPTIEGFMASPDGLIGDVGLWEGKAPTPRVHMEYMKGRRVPEEYLPQCLSQLACSPNRQWLDFTSFNPDFPPRLQMFMAPRMYREEWAEQIAATEAGVRKVLDDIAKVVQELTDSAPSYERREHHLKDQLRKSLEDVHA